MPLNPKFAILMDGGFVTKKLGRKNGRFPTVEEIEAECDRIKANPALSNCTLLRTYWYDAAPASETITNPISGQSLNLATTQVHNNHKQLQQSLETRPDFALRMGDAAIRGWKLGDKAMRSLTAAPRVPAAEDLVPNIEQKGVDLRVGLDIARIALRGHADIIVAVTGDSDFIPAFKFARREGIRVYLDHMGHSVRRELIVHTDLVL